VLGVGICLSVAYAALRTGALSGHAATPLLRLGVGLGCVCGFCGWVAVGRLGGDAATWLALWEAWVGVQVLACSCAAVQAPRCTCSDCFVLGLTV
jgi:hypothetical protein